MKKLLFTLVLVLGSMVTVLAENYPYRSDYLWLTVPDHADWLYKVGEKAKVEVNFTLYGMPQGGALSLITAGLDPRVTACVANHPALSDMAGYLDNRAGGYPHFNRLKGMLTPEKVETMQYYDVVNFARRITCPVYLTWGYNDNVCPPTTSYIVWNLITAPKESLITPVNEHWTTPETNYGQMLWLKGKLKN